MALLRFLKTKNAIYIFCVKAHIIFAVISPHLQLKDR